MIYDRFVWSKVYCLNDYLNEHRNFINFWPPWAQIVLHRCVRTKADAGLLRDLASASACFGLYVVEILLLIAAHIEFVIFLFCCCFYLILNNRSHPPKAFVSFTCFSAFALIYMHDWSFYGFQNQSLRSNVLGLKFNFKCLIPFSFKDILGRPCHN